MVSSPAWVDTLHTNTYQRLTTLNLSATTTPKAETISPFLVKNAFPLTKYIDSALTLSPLIGTDMLAAFSHGINITAKTINKNYF